MRTPSTPSWASTRTAERVLFSECGALVDRYLTLEDPDMVNAVGMELKLEINLDGVLLRGIIDRLDVTDDGEFVVVDYKTGRVPSETFEHGSMGGVQFYALLCEELLGRRPSKVRLLYLRGPLSIEAQPTDQTVRAFRQRTAAVWKAIERACESEDFRPKPSPLCRWCSFQSLCPAFGGDPSQAATWKKPGLMPAVAPVATATLEAAQPFEHHRRASSDVVKVSCRCRAHTSCGNHAARAQPSSRRWRCPAIRTSAGGDLVCCGIVERQRCYQGIRYAKAVRNTPNSRLRTVVSTSSQVDFVTTMGTLSGEAK